MLEKRLAAALLLLAGFGIGYFVYSSEQATVAEEFDPENPGQIISVEVEPSFPFKFGLDLQGGTHLIYRADVSEIEPTEVPGLMNALRDVIERRVNLFGVAEPVVQVEQGGAFAGVREERLIIELPGVTDIAEAVRLIGETPLLEFKLFDETLAAATGTASTTDPFVATSLTGRYLERAVLEFGVSHTGAATNEPIVVLEFNREGGDLFEQITIDHTGEILGIFLDGEPISTPVINEPIAGGSAIITGQFSPEEARTLVRDLNFGALPVPIELISTQTIGASLGAVALEKGIKAGIIGLSLVALFMLLWYRLPGVLAILSLAIYIAIMLAIFKLIPVTLTAAGVAGFILSIGMAVDANVLIFERMKEEFLSGKDTEAAVKDGFARAWRAIRDGNISSILTAIILFWFGTSLVEGFALTFGVGIIISMLTAITITRSFLYAIGKYEFEGATRLLFGSGVNK